MPENTYWTYRAHLVEVVDGDTVDIRVDLGFKTYKKIRVRLDDVDTNEIYGVEKESSEYQLGKEQQRFVRDFLDADGEWPLTFESRAEKGKYGRWIGDIYVDEESLTEALLREWPDVKST
jgi:micrococcal nuclease